MFSDRPGYAVHADGGVSADTAAVVGGYGVDVCVVGSALFQRGRDTAARGQAVKREARAARRDHAAECDCCFSGSRARRSAWMSRSSGRSGRAWSCLVGIGHGDESETVRAMADKAVDLRIFRDDEGKTNRSLIDVGGEVLAISQFTLYADTRKGRRPSFLDAAPPELGNGSTKRSARQSRRAASKSPRGYSVPRCRLSLSTTVR